MNFHSQKILVVEDEKLQRDLLQTILTKLGYTAEFAEDAEKALKILENEYFPLVITDLCMPDMEGTELCKQIRKISPESVIYALSGYIAAFDPEKLDEIGFDGYLSKPAKIEVLNQTIKGAFEKIDQKKRNDGKD